MHGVIQVPTVLCRHHVLLSSVQHLSAETKLYKLLRAVGAQIYIHGEKRKGDWNIAIFRICQVCRL